MDDLTKTLELDHKQELKIRLRRMIAERTFPFPALPGQVQWV